MTADVGINIKIKTWQASELSKRGIFADESVKNKADELLKANAKRLSDYYRSLL